MSAAPVQVAMVLASHSGNLAKGVVEVAAQMAPDVSIRAAGGTDDDRIGTSYDRIEAEITRERTSGLDVLVLADLGSAKLTVDSVLEAGEDEHVLLVDAPFVEGAVAAAVAAQSGGDLAAVAAAARGAASAFSSGDSDREDGAEGTGAGDDGEQVTRTLTLVNSLGLHARPAAQVARKAGEHDAQVTINEVDAASVLSLMGLGLTKGDEVRLSATGPQASEAVEDIAADIEAGFGEE